MVAAVHPNVGLEKAYRKKLYCLIDEMATSVQHWLRAAYRKSPPRLAQDAKTPADKLNATMEALGDRWLAQFDDLSDYMAEWFSKSVETRSRKALQAALRQGGMSVKFQMTPAMRDIFDATVNENVGLIRSIPQQYLGEVQQLVARSVTRGRDLGYLNRELLKRYNITKRRAALISLDQNNKATSAMTRARQQELGLKALWKHSHAGKEPRPTHLANDNKPYDPAKGWFDPDPKVRRRIWPGELINCRCTSRSIVPGFD